MSEILLGVNSLKKRSQMLLFSVRLSQRWRCSAHTRAFATATERPHIPQTIIEKVVQKYTVGIPPEKVVKAGDYVMIRPEHVMTHDNTGPVISK
jgi:homoaconitate hydratase